MKERLRRRWVWECTACGRREELPEDPVVFRKPCVCGGVMKILTVKV